MDPLEPIRRSLPSEVVAGGGRLLRGLIPYNAPTRIFERGKTFTEVIRPGAFVRALGGARDVICTFNHDVNRLLGRTASGTLRLCDTQAGLVYVVDLPESAADVRELLSRGDLRGSSFFGVPLPEGQRWTRDLRELTALDIAELGPVVFPAYPASGAELRAGDPLAPVAGSRLSEAQVRLMERS